MLSLLLCLGLGLFAQLQSKVTKTLTPMLSTIPVVYQANVQGGLHQVANQTERDALPANMKADGMLVWVTADNACYQWNGTTAAWGQVSLIKTWATGATFAVGDVFLYNKTLVQAKAAGTITGATNPATDTANWDGIGSSVPFNGLAAATATNTLDNKNLAQTWNWTTAAAENPLTINADALTTVKALNISSASTGLTAGGSLLNVASTATAATGKLLNLTSASTSAFANGGVNLNFTGAHTGNGLQIDDATLTGKTAQINANTLTTGTALDINVNSLTNGKGLSISSTSSSMTSGSLLSTTSNSTYFGIGGVTFYFNGSHSGNGLYIDDNTLTGNAAKIKLYSLTTGSGLSITSSSTANTSTAGLLNVANTTATTTGTILRAQANSTAGSGLTVLASGNTGLGIAAPVATLHNAGSTILGVTTATNATSTYTVPVTSVDGYSGVVITQTGSAGAITVTPPTDKTAGRTFTIANDGVGSAYPLTVGTYTIPKGSVAQLVWDGGAWSIPSATASTVPFSGLTAATVPNTLDNKNLSQTWNWTTGDIQSLLNINADALTTGTGLTLSSATAAATGNLLRVTSSSAGTFTNGGINFIFGGDHQGTGFLVSDVTTTGTAAQINANLLTTGKGLGIAANALTTGSALSLASTATGTTGNLLAVTSASTSAFTNGGVNLNFTGAHTGSGFQIDDKTLTGTAAQINANLLTTGAGLGIAANALTTGNALSVASTGTGITTGSLLNVSGKVAATTVTNGIFSVINTAASSTGTVATVQANSTAGSGITVLANGFVGIGNAAPTVTLDVTGDAKVSGTFTCPSDIRLKTKVETLTDVLSRLEQMRGVTYEFKDQTKYAKGPQIGVIAQELQKVFPELVKLGSDGFYSVNYTQLTAVLIQAVKEQQTEINELKGQMKRVMEKLDLR